MSARCKAWVAAAALFLTSSGAAADVDELITQALADANARIECQQTAPADRQSPCDHCDADYLYPLDVHVPELLACEADHWLSRIRLEAPDLPECARGPLVDQLLPMTSPRTLAELQDSYVPQRLAIQKPQGLADPDDPLAVPFVRWVLFEGSQQEVELGREDGAPAPAADLCVVSARPELPLVIHAVVSVNRYAAKANEGLLATGAKGLVRLRDDWAWFLEKGLGQFPWERALNAFTDRRGGIADLPTRQWVLLHPSIAVEIDESDFSVDELRVQDSLLVEPFGVVRYRFAGSVDEPERAFWGGSLLLALREDQDPGYGLLLRRGTFGLGGVWREVTTDGREEDEISVVLTLDLLGRVQKEQEKYLGYRETLSRVLD
jgi:hypothetical protein